jgi:sensor domain CHASE-containing protein
MFGQRPQVDTREVRMQYSHEVESRIKRWSEATQRLHHQASDKPTDVRVKIEADLAAALHHLDEIRKRAEDLKKTGGVAWHQAASMIARSWDQFQIAYDSVRSRL